MPNPFDDFSFDNQQVQTISADDITRVLTNMNGPNAIQDGIDRVNRNTADSGTVAYKDEKGQAVLTNVARDPVSGQEKQIAALLRPPAQEQTATGQATSTYVAPNDTRLALFEGVKKLTATTNIEQARAIYSSIQESLAGEQARLETEAYAFAEQKFGIPEVMKQIESNRQLDRSDPKYLPGSGDSPVTQKIVEQARLLSATAKQDADGYLKRNLTFNSLKTLAVTAEREYRRVETNADRLAQITLNKELSADNAESQALLNQRIRAEDREERRTEEAQKIYNSLSSTQIARITMLNGADIAGIENEKQRQIKIADLAMGNKDKKYRDAVMAESATDLLGMALQGNGIARKLVVLEEAQKTGMSVEDVESRIKNLSLRLADPKLASEVLNRNFKMQKGEKEARLSSLNAAQFTTDPNKKLEANQQRLALLMEDAQFKIQQQFLGDVSSWGLVDPSMIAAIDRSKKVTGRADVRSVLTAYIEDVSGNERRMRLQEFQKAMKNAALKQKDSVFGAPNWREAEKIIIENVVDRGWFGRMVNHIKHDPAIQQTDNDLKMNTAQFPHPAANLLQNLSGLMINATLGNGKE